MENRKHKNKGKRYKEENKTMKTMKNEETIENQDENTKKEDVAEKTVEVIEESSIPEEKKIEENESEDNIIEENKNEETIENQDENTKKEDVAEKTVEVIEESSIPEGKKIEENESEDNIIEENKNKDNVNNNEKEQKNKKTAKKNCYVLIIILAIIFVLISLYIVLRPKFKDVTIELGTEKIDKNMFLVNRIYEKKAETKTDLNQIDLSKTGEHQITFIYNGKEQTVTLKVVDTIAPNVTFQNIKKYIDYEIKAEDFIAEKSDLSEITFEILDAPEDITEYRDYDIKISVKDSAGNETIGNCILTIAWIKSEVTVELGEEISIEDFIFDVKKYGQAISKEELKKIDTKTIGEYEIKAEYEGNEYISKVIVQDTTPPELELKNITIYDDESIGSYKKFIKKVSDASGEPTTTLKTNIDYKNIGTQEIIIEAEDVNGNKVQKTATFTIKKDNEGPVISGLGDLTVKKNSKVNFLSGVSAKDAKDGTCEVAVNSNNVNLASAGTYYATYTSKDKKGNTTTKKRKIKVLHDQADTTAKFETFYNNYCAGKNPVGIAHAIRQQIGYNSNWGGDDPVWYGLTEGKGNCYVHTVILKRALEKAGYSNKIIHLTDKSHYWNIVYVNGKWWHIDATPSANHTEGLLTNEQKLADRGLHNKTWDVSKWPELYPEN